MLVAVIWPVRTSSINVCLDSAVSDIDPPSALGGLDHFSSQDICCAEMVATTIIDLQLTPVLPVIFVDSPAILASPARRPTSADFFDLVYETWSWARRIGHIGTPVPWWLPPLLHVATLSDPGRTPSVESYNIDT
jgi:hypothetical protein